MNATLRALVLAVAVPLVVGCQPPGGEDLDAGGGGSGGSGGTGGSGGAAPGTVTLTHTGLPTHLRVQVGTGYRDTPSVFDGGIVWTGGAPVTAASAQDTYSGATGSATGSSRVTLVQGGVEFSLDANVNRTTGSNPVVAMMAEQISLCISGADGRTAKLDVACVGTVNVTGSGISGLLVGTSSNERAYCSAWYGPGMTNVALPLSGTATKVISGDKTCFPVHLSWTAGIEVSGAPTGTVAVAGGKVTVTASLLP